MAVSDISEDLAKFGMAHVNFFPENYFLQMGNPEKCASSTGSNGSARQILKAKKIFCISLKKCPPFLREISPKKKSFMHFQNAEEIICLASGCHVRVPHINGKWKNIAI